MGYITWLGMVLFVCTLAYLGTHVIAKVDDVKDDLKKEITPPDERDEA